MYFVRQRGFTLIEMLVYTAILVLLSGFFVTVLVRSVVASNDLHEMRSIRRSARISIERLSREIRSAYDIHAGSSFDVDPGRLVLNTSDLGDTGPNKDFYVSNEILYVADSTGGIARLTDADTKVVSLIFSQFPSGNAKGVRVQIVLQGAGTGNVTETFYTSGVIRRLY